MSITSLPFLQTAPSATGSMLTTIIPFGAVILIFYFLIIRPQNKQRKETERMLSALKKSDKIVTIGGIHGVVLAVKESSVIVKIDEGTKIEINRSAVASVKVDGAKAEKPAKGGKAITDTAAESMTADDGDAAADDTTK